MNEKFFLGFACRIDGEQFISPSGKRVWKGTGPLKNALHYHAKHLLKKEPLVVIYKVYEDLQPFQECQVKTTPTNYGYSVIEFKVKND